MKNLRELIAAVGLVVMVGVVAMHYTSLPQVIPIHFNGAGVADGWGNKSMVWFLVAVGCVVYAGMTLASFFPNLISMPVSRERLQAAQPIAIEMIGWVKVIAVWMFAWINWMTVSVAMGRSTGLGPWFLPVTMVAIFGTMGFYLWRIMKVPL